MDIEPLLLSTSGLLQRRQILMAHSMLWVDMMEEITWSKISIKYFNLSIVTLIF